MAKVISYNQSTERKLGFRKARKETDDLDSSQLNLFRQAKNLQILRHLDPFEKGLELDERNEELAEKCYREAIDSKISMPDAYCNLGIIHARKGTTAKAIDCFTRALIEDPRHTEAHYNLANMYYDAGNFPLAITHYEVAWEMEGAFPEIAYNLALAYLSNGQKNEAIDYFKMYMNICKPDDQRQARLLINLLEQ